MSWLSAQLREREWHSHESRKFVPVERRLRMQFGIAEVLEIQTRDVRRRRLFESYASGNMWPVSCECERTCLLTRGGGDVPRSGGMTVSWAMHSISLRYV